jgi:hypothetical protein
MTFKVRGLWSWDVRRLLPPLSLKRSLFIYGTIAIVATGVMIPRLREPNFGLLDDAVTISVLSHVVQEFKAGNLGVLFTLESERGRFWPLRFLYYALPYAVSGLSSFGFFVVQWLSLVLTGIVIFGAVEVATRDPVAGVLSSIFYILSPPVIENYYTLSKGEPPMVLWLALSLFLLFKSTDIFITNRKRASILLIASTFSLCMAYFTKETAHAMLLISAIWSLNAIDHIQNAQNRHIFETRLKYFIINIIIVGTYWGARVLSTTAGIASGEDSGNYKFIREIFYTSLLRHIGWYVRDFSYLLPILLFWVGLMFVIRRNDQPPRNLSLLDCVLWIASWTAIMLPWHSTLEYYLLPATLGVSMIAGISVSAMAKHLWDPSKAVRRLACMTLLCVLLMSSIGLANSFTNGRIQVAVDSANTDLINYLARNMPKHGTLLVNLPEPSEYVFEIGLHLAVLKRRQDIHVRYFNSLKQATDSGAFIVTPIMQNQLYPSVRIAVQEGGAKIWKSELDAKVGDRATLVYQTVKKAPLFTVAVEKTVCPLLMRANVQDGVDCGVKKPAIDLGVFRYGWEVYRI